MEDLLEDPEVQIECKKSIGLLLKGFQEYRGQDNYTSANIYNTKDNNKSKFNNEEHDFKDLKTPLLPNNVASTLTLYKSYDSFSDKTEALLNNQSLIQQTEAIVKFNESSRLQGNSSKNCCVVLSVSEIKYDSPLLNQPELLQKFINIHGANSGLRLVNLIGQIDVEFVDTICSNTNALSILESLMGID